MAGLIETSQWEAEIYRIEPNDPVEGGEDGVDNRSAKQLANRTLYLKNTLESFSQSTEDNLDALAALISDEEEARQEAVSTESEARSAAVDEIKETFRVSGIGIDLKDTNNATGLDFNESGFRVEGTWYFEYDFGTTAVNAPSQLIGGILTVKKAGDKAYQQVTQDDGMVVNRMFDGAEWSAWKHVNHAGLDVISQVGYTLANVDLNTIKTTGYYGFNTDDTINHAPTDSSTETAFILHVIAYAANESVMQIAYGTTTGTTYTRFFYDSGSVHIGWASWTS